MEPYQLLLVYEVVEFIESLGPREQADFHRRLRQLRKYPYNNSQSFELNRDGRRIEVTFFRKYAIKYWIGEADKEVKVLEIVSSDRWD